MNQELIPLRARIFHSTKMSVWHKVYDSVSESVHTSALISIWLTGKNPGIQFAPLAGPYHLSGIVAERYGVPVYDSIKGSL